MENYTVSLIVIVLCIIMSAYFSATETAFSSLNRIRIKNLADKGNKKAKLVQEMSQSYDALLSTILIGNNIVNIALASLATVLFVQILGNDYGPGVSTLVVTLVVLIFGEISPKSIAKESPEKFAMLSAPLLKIFMVSLTPVNFLFKLWKKLLSAVFKTSDDSTITEEELLTIVDEAERGGGIVEQQGMLIRNAIEFPDLKVYEIMTPRLNITAIDITSDKGEVATAFCESGYSRLPVYKDSIDNIIGVIYIKDFYNQVYHKDSTIKDIVRDVLFCTKSCKIGRLMKKLQQEKLHIAAVIDEFGGTVGLVTMEDLLEELVGEIWDEHDNVITYIEKLDENQYTVLGGTNVKYLFEQFGRVKEFDAVTVSGWITNAIGRIPQEGEQFTIDETHVTVQKMTGPKIDKLVIRNLKVKE